MVRVTRLCAPVFILFLASPAGAQRLPGNVVPEHYTLWFAPDLEKETFRGRESIDVVLTERSPMITLHAAEITFSEVKITSGGRTQTARVTLDANRDMATFTVPEPIAEGRATIQIEYTGILNDKLRGFYVSKANGRKYAVTQMEATDARRAFPSFDEPAFKATFDISMTIDAGDTAISNGKQLSDTPGPEPGKHTLTFARTPKMSTYLAAMLVGDFVCRDGASDGIDVRVCSTPDKLNLTAFALEAAVQQLAFYNNYFGIRYPFGKLDIIAVPDFSAGAMENAGAITFRERLLLVDPATSSVTARKNVASIISHEIAHQWFGNLVTMKWWDDIWLNEGFATWMANKPVADWRPDWHVELDEAMETQGALSIDAMRSTRPIRFKVETPAEINEVFDGIAYQKTAAVLRMLESYVGADGFKRGVASYLKRFSYANASGEDFWNEVANVTGKPVDRILRSFVDQPGAPVLAVETRCVANKATEVDLTMGRFIGVPGAPRESRTWTLPVCIQAGTGQPRCEVVDRRKQTVRLNACSNTGQASGGSPVVVNADSRGYYFTEYSPDVVRALAASATAFDAVERLSLIGDEWWMVRGGRHDVGVYLDLASALANDGASAVIDMLAGRLEVIGDTLVSSADQPAYEAWIRMKFGSQLNSIGLPGNSGDDDQVQLRRATLLTLAGYVGNDRDVQKRSRDLVAMYLEDPRSLPSTIAPPILQVAALDGGQTLYERYIARLGELAAKPEEYYRFLNALPWFRDPALIKRTLEYAVSPAVRTQDTGTLLGNLMLKPWSQEATWSFVQVNWTTIVKTLGEFQGIPSIVGSLGGFCSTARANEIRAFFKKNPIASSQRGIQQAIERIENCVALKERQAKPFAAWIAQR
jgi:aminopeptidase N